MELFSVIGQFLLIWFFIYIVVFGLQFLSTKDAAPKRSAGPSGLLPTFSITHANGLERDQWSIQLFQVKYTTYRLNGFFQSLSSVAPGVWKVWFALGALVASVTMVVGMVVICFAGLKILTSLSHLGKSSSSLSKRELGESDDQQVFLPMIPGVTLPMSHIGYYLLALTLCGLFHEAGHAMASFAEGVPIQSSGMFIMYLYPGAFVNIPDQPLQSLAPFRQLKIVCAGVWHNLVLYLVTSLCLAGGLECLLTLTGWQSLKTEGGVSVVHVRTHSPLASHLPPSTWIRQLDDTVLTNTIDDWNAFLFKDDGRHTSDLGFCALPAQEEYGLACCDITDAFPFGQAVNTSISCFQTIDKTVDKQCLLTLAILGNKNSRRCYRSTDCNHDESCVTAYMPSSAGQVVRITAQYPGWIEGGTEKTFVFEGELVDIWESVKVSILRPRFWILPHSLPHTIELVLRYIASFTVALALLNILPAFKLDGEFALEQILTLWMRPTDMVSTTRTHVLARRIQEVTVKVTSMVVGFVIVGSLVMGLITALS